MTSSTHEQPLPPALRKRNPLPCPLRSRSDHRFTNDRHGGVDFFRARGALFGYHILFPLVLISVLKWGLVFATALHMVLSGVHPYQRMLELPGPRGWFPLLLFLLVAICMPVWTSFHSGVLDNFTSWVRLTATQRNFRKTYRPPRF